MSLLNSGSASSLSELSSSFESSDDPSSSSEMPHHSKPLVCSLDFDYIRSGLDAKNCKKGPVFGISVGFVLGKPMPQNLLGVLRTIRLLELCGAPSAHAYLGIAPPEPSRQSHAAARAIGAKDLTAHAAMVLAGKHAKSFFALSARCHTAIGHPECG